MCVCACVHACVRACVCVCAHGDNVDNTDDENSSVFCLIRVCAACHQQGHAGLRAAKLCTNKILQFLNGGVG